MPADTPLSIHRALAAAQNGSKGDASSDNPHVAAIGRLQTVTMPKPPVDNSVKPQLQKVDLGRDTSSTGMNFTQPEEKSGNLVTNK
jgi:hypothetical protein